MKKKILIIIGILLVALFIFILFFYKGVISNKEQDLSVIDKITLNENEQEILSELRALKFSLENPENSDNTNNEVLSNKSVNFTMTPTESIKLKEFCTKINEARKTISDDGGTYYLFDMDVKNGENVRKRILVTQNGKLINYTTYEDDFDFSNIAENSTTERNGDSVTLSFGKEFYKDFFEYITKSIEDLWEEASTFENVNYDKIYNEL